MLIYGNNSVSSIEKPRSITVMRKCKGCHIRIWEFR